MVFIDINVSNSIGGTQWGITSPIVASGNYDEVTTIGPLAYNVLNDIMIEDMSVINCSNMISISTENLTDRPTTIDELLYCQHDAALPLTANGQNILWFDHNKALIGDTAPNPDTDIAGVFNYYVLQSVDGCESELAIITVTIEDCGCVNPSEITSINSNSNIVCVESNIVLSVELSGAAVSGVWTVNPAGSGFFDNSTGLIAVFIPNDSGELEFTFTTNDPDGEGVCESATEIIQVSVVDIPIANAGEIAALGCGGLEVELNGENSTLGLIYEWSGPGIIGDNTNTIVKVGQQGTYYLEVFDPATMCSALDSVVVSFSEADVVVDYTVKNTDCEHSMGSLIINSVDGGQEPYTIKLNGELVIEEVLLSPDTYVLIVSDANGCSFEKSFIIDDIIDWSISIDASEEEIKSGENTDLSLNSTLMSDEIVSIVWSDESLIDCINCSEINVKPLETTQYKVVVIDVNGCVKTAEITIRVKTIPDITITNIFSPNDDGVNDIFSLFGNDDKFVVQLFTIYDRWGNKTWSINNIELNNSNVGWDGKKRGKLLLPGVYVYQILLQDKETGEIKQYHGDITLVH
ncbi:MAG: gliding motility-associated C-terminal domain-containing protein [Saprospiraceae bacterium]